MTDESASPRVRRDDALLGFGPTRTVQAYGTTWIGPLAVADGWAAPRPGSPIVTIEPTSFEHAHSLVTERVETVWRGATDGAPFAALRGAGKEVSFHHGDHTLAVLSAEQDRLLFGSSGADPLILSRTILDSVMHTVALELGFIAMHGAGLAGATGSLIVVGRSGAGKSSLAKAMMDAGLALVSDDIQVLERDGDVLVCHPAPPVTTRPVASGTPPEAILGTLDGEDWIAQAVEETPRPVRAVVLLEQHDRPAMRRGVIGVLDLLDHVMGVPRHVGRKRFDTLGDLVDQARILPVRSYSAPADELARSVFRQLSDLGIKI